MTTTLDAFEGAVITKAMLKIGIVFSAPLRDDAQDVFLYVCFHALKIAVGDPNYTNSSDRICHGPLIILLTINFDRSRRVLRSRKVVC